MTNEQVAQAFLADKTASNGRGNFISSGDKLYSYQMLIGITLPGGRKLVLNQWKERTTPTTQQHAGIAAQAGAEMVIPESFHMGIQALWNGEQRPIKIWEFSERLLSQAL